MAVTKTTHNLPAPWTQEQLILKIMELLEAKGVVGSQLDSFESSYGTKYVYKRTYSPADKTVKWPDQYLAVGAQSNSFWVHSWVDDGTGSWDAIEHEMVPCADAAEYYTCVKTTWEAASGYYGATYGAAWALINKGNTNQELPISVYTSSVDPDFYWITVDDGGRGLSFYLPTSNALCSALIPLEELYLFPVYTLGHGTDYTLYIDICSIGETWSQSWCRRGVYNTNVSWANARGISGTRFGDTDRHQVGFVRQSANGSEGIITILPDTYAYLDKVTARQGLYRGYKYSDWMKNDTFPDDIALIVDPEVTTITRVGQPYIVNGTRYEVVGSNNTSNLAILVLAQMED